MATYHQWLYKQLTQDDKEIAHFAEWAFSNIYWDKKQKSLRTYVKAHDQSNQTNLNKVFERSLSLFRQTPKPQRKTARGPYCLKYGKFDQTFQKKDDIKKFYRDLLTKGELTDEDQDKLRALFLHHHNYQVTGFEHITTGRNPYDQTYCFLVNGEPISYGKCINNIGHEKDDIEISNKIRNFISASRFEILGQVIAVEKHNADDHIDHKIFFSSLLLDWCRKNNIRISKTELIDERSRRRFADHEISQSWRDFHATHCELQCLPSAANIQKQPARNDWMEIY